MPEQDFNKLAAAMTVNNVFKLEVLDRTTRVSAIATGYLGEHFDFTEKEEETILKIEAKSFADFAEELHRIKKETLVPS